MDRLFTRAVDGASAPHVCKICKFAKPPRAFANSETDVTHWHAVACVVDERQFARPCTRAGELATTAGMAYLLPGNGQGPEMDCLHTPTHTDPPRPPVRDRNEMVCLHALTHTHTPSAVNQGREWFALHFPRGLGPETLPRNCHKMWRAVLSAHVVSWAPPTHTHPLTRPENVWIASPDTQCPALYFVNPFELLSGTGDGRNRVCKTAARVCKLGRRRNSLACTGLRSR